MSNQQWINLGVDEQIVSSLIKRGINTPFPIQDLTIPDALQGNDVCGKAKTGSGKTLAFGIPMVQNLDQSSGETDPRGLIMAVSYTHLTLPTKA